MEEVFFFHYHLHMNRADYMSIPVHERKWLVRRFMDQKRREHEEMEKIQKKGKTR